tara:strand:- start:165 stop:488 length:324 start_codon:yes stop_codon:yes gene_type:complete
MNILKTTIFNLSLVGTFAVLLNEAEAFDTTIYNTFDNTFSGTYSYEPPTSFQFSQPDFSGTTRGTIGGSSFEMYAPDFSGTTRGRIGSSSFEMYAPDFNGTVRGYFK